MHHLQKMSKSIRCDIFITISSLSPFPEYSEFYVTYKLLNIKNQHLYSDKFILGAVDLTHIELATCIPILSV